MRSSVVVSFIIALAVSLAAAKCPPIVSILPCVCTDFMFPQIGCGVVLNFTGIKVMLAHKLDKDFVLAINYLDESKIKKSSVSGQRIKSLAIQRLFTDEIEADAFADMNNSLTQVSIGNSNLKSIPVSALRSLGKLMKLEITHAGVKDIRKSEMDQLPTELTFLNLNYNPIVNIENGAFSHLSNLESISLANCELGKLPANWLPASIHSLVLTGNHFWSVPIKSLSTVNPISVKMDDNHVINIPVEADLKPFLSKGSSLDLNKNPLMCTCSLEWIVKFRKTTKKNGLKGLCSGDVSRFAKRIENLGYYDFLLCL